MRLATVPQVRGLPMSQDPKLNSHSKLNCVLACIQAEKAGADEALMLDPHGFVNSTNACNFFIVRRGEVWTSTGDYCLNGITRAKVIALCRADGIPVPERNFSLVETYGAEEAFLTGTFGGQTPGRRDRRPPLRRRRRRPGDPAAPGALRGARRPWLTPGPRTRIAMWSGPRNLSTAMMRSFGNRADCAGVLDEPFYAAYLAATGMDHPMRDEVLASQPQDWRAVAARLRRRAVAPGRSTRST